MGIGVCTVWTKDCQDTLNMMYFFFFESIRLGSLSGKKYISRRVSGKQV